MRPVAAGHIDCCRQASRAKLSVFEVDDDGLGLHGLSFLFSLGSCEPVVRPAGADLKHKQLCALFQLYCVAVDGAWCVYQPLLDQKCLKTGIAAPVHGRGTQREARQGIAPGAAV